MGGEERQIGYVCDVGEDRGGKAVRAGQGRAGKGGFMFRVEPQGVMWMGS